MTKITIAGFDPSMSSWGMFKMELHITNGKVVGYSYKECKLIKTAKGKNKSVRVNSDDLSRARTLNEGIKDFLSDVQAVCVEIPVGSQSAAAMKSYGMCVALLGTIDLPLIQVTPSEVKIAATGNKNATKKQMIDWAVSKLPDADWLINRSNGSYTNDNEHLADAFASIVAGAKTDEFKLLIS